MMNPKLFLLSILLLLTACTANPTPSTSPTTKPNFGPGTALSPTSEPARATEIPPTGIPATATPTAPHPLISYKDATYLIEGQAISLINGMAEIEAAPGSASKITTRYFGNEAVGDLNGDGRDDIAFLLTQETGGSGTFFYLVAALQTDTGYQGTNGLLLGDRIAPQTTHIENGIILLTYADRNPGESFDVPPSWGISKYMQVKDNVLVEVNAP